MHDRLTVTCPTPRTLASNEHECPACGLIWDTSDERPACDRQASGQEPPAPRRKPAYHFKPKYMHRE